MLFALMPRCANPLQILTWSRIIQKGTQKEAADTIRAAQALATAVLQVLQEEKAYSITTQRNSSSSSAATFDSSSNNGTSGSNGTVHAAGSVVGYNDTGSSSNSDNVLSSWDSLEGLDVQAVDGTYSFDGNGMLDQPGSAPSVLAAGAQPPLGSVQRAGPYSGVAQLVDWLADLPEQVQAREQLLQVSLIMSASCSGYV